MISVQIRNPHWEVVCGTFQVRCEVSQKLRITSIPTLNAT